jgi:glutamyl-tRNA synthetase
LIRGRFAPSPTGDLHLGGARTALVAWLDARSRGGRFLLRVEDLDPPRVVAGAEARILEDLRILGLDWDGAIVRQSERFDRYQETLERLDRDRRLFPCYCSRAEVARASQAPQQPGDEARYPGTCRTLTRDQIAAHERAGRRPSLRFRVEPEEVAWEDGVLGPQTGDPSQQVGDFVVRRADGLYAYQLAVVVDDAAMGVTDVVRGADLTTSTPRQILLHRALGAAPPRFAHVPLVLGPDGERLAKRHGAIAVREAIARGLPAPLLLARLAASLGLAPPDRPIAPPDLLPGFDLARLPRAPSAIDRVTSP